MIGRSLQRWWRSLRSVSPYELPEVVSLDLETSSLDPRTAEILSIAAVPVRDRQARRIPLVERLTPEIDALADGGGPRGRGGMETKLAAARIATRSGCLAAIANGREIGVLDRLFAGDDVGQLKLMLHALGHYRPELDELPRDEGFRTFDVETAEAVKLCEFVQDVSFGELPAGSMPGGRTV